MVCDDIFVVEWNFFGWSYFIVFVCSIITVWIPLLSFRISLHRLDTRTPQAEKKRKTDPEDRNRNETNKTAFSNFTYEKNALRNWKQFICLCACFYVVVDDGFLSLFSVTVCQLIHRNKYEVCCNSLWWRVSRTQIEHLEAYNRYYN